MKSRRQKINQFGYYTLLILAGQLLLSSCTLLQPAKSSSISTYAIEVQFDSAGVSSGQQTLLVATMGARPGYDSRRMVYTKRPHELEFFTRNQWVDSPARMLTPLLVQALESSAKYRTVVSTHNAVAADLRLDTDIIRLQHDFTSRPSQVRLTVRAQLSDVKAKRIIASREFNVTEAATSEDPYGGVLATNRAVKTLLQQMMNFCEAGNKAPIQ